MFRSRRHKQTGYTFWYVKQDIFDKNMKIVCEWIKEYIIPYLGTENPHASGPMPMKKMFFFDEESSEIVGNVSL